VSAHPPALTIPPAPAGCSAWLAGFLKSENSISNSLGKVDESELTCIEKVVVSALIDDSYEIVLGCPGVASPDAVGFVPM
jgi:hypothetical protein